jgi:hypothetical protein
MGGNLMRLWLWIVVALMTGACTTGDGGEARWWDTPASPGNGGGTTETAVHLVIEPPVLDGGASATGAVTVFPPAGDSGTRVDLSSSDAAVGVPATVTVAPGASRATFAIATRPAVRDVFATLTAATAVATTTATIDVLGVQPTSLTWISSTGTLTSRWGRYTPPTASFNGRCENGNEVVLHVTGWDQFVRLVLAAPPGMPMRPGVYDNARQVSGRPAGTPGLEISGDSGSCRTQSGRFVVTESELLASGSIQRFHATFEIRCSTVSTLFVRGEVRLNRVPSPAFSTSCLR